VLPTVARAPPVDAARLALDPAQAPASGEKIRALRFTPLLTGHGAPASA
jgi:hypothetical protein